MARLPQELLDAIVDHLAQDTESLQRCCVASRHFIRAAQKQLFDIIDLRGDAEPVEPSTSGGLARALSTILSSSPHLGSYIGQLHLGLLEREPEDHAALEHVLGPGMLPKLRKISIQGDGMALWPSLADALCELCLRLRALDLGMLGVSDVPLPVIRAAMTFQRDLFLGIIAPTQSSEWNDAQLARYRLAKRPEEPPLRKLILIQGPHPSLSDLLGGFDELSTQISQLQILENHILDDPPVLSQQLIEGSSKTLRSLLLRLLPLDTEPISFPSLPSLTRAHIIAELDETNEMALPDSFSPLLVGLVSAAPQLIHLALEFTAYDLAKELEWDFEALPVIKSDSAPKLRSSLMRRSCIDHA
uniref:F-box domain-containing protein n=1 Tax=Mycena chlorophos TaxID=658473 RepID=A0ABQ0M8R6_MYCCL|nr:predicted protein [Mycena chlorophos]